MNESISEYRGSVLELDHDHTLDEPEFHINRIANFLSLKPNKQALDYIKNHKK